MQGKRNTTHLEIPITLTTLDNHRNFDVNALLDCGAASSVIDTDYVKAKDLPTQKLPHPIPIYNADGSPNATASIREVVDLCLHIGHHIEQITFKIVSLGTHHVFLGYDWFRRHNPTINWLKSTVSFTHCPYSCNLLSALCEDEDVDDTPDELNSSIIPDEPLQDDEHLLFIDLNQEYINCVTFSMEFAAKAQETVKDEPWTKTVLQHYHSYHRVFTKDGFDKLPPHRPWDHAIEFKPGSQPLHCKIYHLNPMEQQQLDSFLDENLSTSRIRPSKSPMTSPFFFI